MGQRIKIRRDTGANWTTGNPTLLDGEMGYDKTAKRNKIGDGVTAWTGLAYITVTDYTDLTSKPVIPAAQVNSDWNSATGLSQILNKPVIPVAQVNSDWNSATGLSQILNKPDLTAITIDGGNAAG